MEGALIETLNGTLQPDASTIKAAETHLHDVLHVDPHAGEALMNVVFADSSAVPFAIRQAAAVNLSLWIKERWSPFFAEFVGFPSPESGSSNALSVEQKPALRASLLNSFTLRETKLRGPMLKALINVASCDWPDEFPDLLPRVKSILHTYHQGASDEVDHAIEGALAFLDEWFYTSMDETSLMSITRELFPDLEAILTNEGFSAQIRCHCISILNQTLETLWMVKEQYPDAAKTVAQELLPKWLSQLERMVGIDPAAVIDACGGYGKRAGEALALQAQAWQTLVTSTHFASYFKPMLPSLQSKALAALASLQASFQQQHLSQAGDVEGVDGLAFFASPSALAAKIVDFLGVLLQRSKSTVDVDFLSTFLPLLFSFSRITSDEEEEWLDNISAFVAAGEDDEMGVLNHSMRGRCADILAEIISSRPTETLAALWQTASQAHQKGVRLRQSGDETWWKDEEASLALVGGVSEYIIEKLEEGSANGLSAHGFDLEALFGISVMPYMTKGSPYFLYGRCFVFASQFASTLPNGLAINFLEAAVQVMERPTNDDEGDAIVQLSAVRCVKNFHRHLSDELVRPYTGRILTRLAPLLLNANEDVLVLIVETLQAVAVQRERGSGNVPASLFGEMASATIQAWAKEAMDRVLQSAIEDLLEAFAGQASDEAALSTLQGGMSCIAPLLEQEAHTADDAAKHRSGVVVEGALEFALAIVRGAKPSVLDASDATALLFSPLFKVVRASEDREVYSNAARLLSTLIAKIPGPSLAWQDEQGTPSVQLILALVSKMISPDDTTESGGLAVGDLLTTLLRKQPQALSADLPSICRALVARLATASSTSLVQSLVIPMAFLMKDHMQTIVSLLLDVRIPPSSTQPEQPALEVLLRKWLEFASSIQGFWNARISTLGLCAVFNARQSIDGVAATVDSIIVNGDLLPDDVNIIKTRSRARMMPDRYTQVPVPAKIIKVIVAEFRQATDGPPTKRYGEGVEGDGDDALSGDDDDDWGDEEDGASSKRQDAFLSDMLGEDLDGDLDNLLHKNDEEQYGDDAVWTMNFRSYLLDFFRQIVKDNAMANALAAHLSADEIQTLRDAVGQ